MQRYEKVFDIISNIDLSNEDIVFLSECSHIDGHNGLVLFEAVIKADEEQIDIINRLLSINVDSPIDFNYLESEINKKLDTYKIIVKFVNIPTTNFYFQGGFNEKTSTIRILTPLSTISTKNYLQFVENFGSFVIHELIHRYQFNKGKYSEVREKLFNIKKQKALDYITQPQNSEKARNYFSDKYELMSYAWQIVESFRIKGMDNPSIQKILQQDSQIKFEYGGQILIDYHNLFHKDSKVLKRLYKYMYEYTIQ
jgi:hypothetical protein